MGDADGQSENMYYRMMGNTGIQVSVLSYGFWATYGIKDRLSGKEGVRTAKELMSIVRNAGVNCFDHAEAYLTSIYGDFRQPSKTHAYVNILEEVYV